ncbi:methyltransferase [Allopontixanthobacter sediminis]|uniref:Methyltransferase n=1 Tax=Allopontixanthobacter sediminis TaxID=1689985 RepID=A0A845B7W2_9SPHN|nr:methyltransferase [Allopontixanthobacter sediminis]MXP45552.1 methyltransferase [Allopontixanthobacter sediminis]
MSRPDDPAPVSLNWRTRWALRRNRILGSRKFQDWAARTPVFRSVARRKAARQFDLVAGFVYTQITYIFVQSGLIGFLGNSARTEAEIVRFLDFPQDAAARILKAGAALGLAESPQRDLWTLGVVGAALSANEGAMAMIRHHALFYRDLSDPFALLKDRGAARSELSRFWTYAPKSAEDSQQPAPYSELMAATQPMVWQQIIGRYSFGSHRRMLDIGGGSGTFVAAVGAHTPGLDLGLFDLPEVVPLAHKRFAGSELEKRVTLHAGSFRTDPIPAGYDLVTLIRILHDHDDDVVQALLAALCESLPVGGKVLIVEPMAETRGAEGMGDAYFGLYLWAMGSGRPRSIHSYVEMAQLAGFSTSKAVPTPLPIIAKALVLTK